MILLGAIALSAILFYALFGLPGGRLLPFAFQLPMLGSVPLLVVITVMLTHKGDSTFRSYRPWLRAIGFFLLGVGYPVVVVGLSARVSANANIPSDQPWAPLAILLPFIIPIMPIIILGYLSCALGSLFLILRGILYERQQAQVLQR